MGWSNLTLVDNFSGGTDGALLNDRTGWHNGPALVTGAQSTFRMTSAGTVRTNGGTTYLNNYWDTAQSKGNGYEYDVEVGCECLLPNASGGTLGIFISLSNPGVDGSTSGYLVRLTGMTSVSWGNTNIYRIENDVITQLTLDTAINYSPNGRITIRHYPGAGSPSNSDIVVFNENTAVLAVQDFGILPSGGYFGIEGAGPGASQQTYFSEIRSWEQAHKASVYKIQAPAVF